MLFALVYVSPVDAQSVAPADELSYEADEDHEADGDLPYDAEESNAELAQQDVTGLEGVMEAPRPPGAPAPSTGTPKKGRGCSVAPGLASSHALLGLLVPIAALRLRRRSARHPSSAARR